MKYTLKKYEESLNHFKEQVCKHCCEWNKSLRHCNTCVTATAKEALQMAIEAMEKQATSNYTSEWIPVSEGLPEGENEVLVTVSGKLNNITFDNAIEIGFYCEIDGWIINGYLDWATPQVTAWQPLPEPWKGEVNE